MFVVLSAEIQGARFRCFFNDQLSGVVFTLDYIVQQLNDGVFFIPPYQREFIWKEKNKCEFIGLCFNFGQFDFVIPAKAQIRPDHPKEMEPQRD